jgi:TPR repeat protein
VRLFGLASAGDVTEAKVEYAIALYNGDGIQRNQPVAVTLFHQAALKNNPVAQNRLAHILASGQGAPTDPVAATKWWLISKAAGETDLALDDFVNKLDPDKRAEGEKQAKKWIDALKKPSLTGN